MDNIPAHECVALVDISAEAIRVSALGTEDPEELKRDIDAYARLLVARLMN